MKMSLKNECSCGKHEKGHHEKMNRSEKIKHLNECLKDVIERLECIKEITAELSSD